ncbi:MAG: phage holin family protein [Desulfobacterales bacterium]|jgi:putative membrane protein|nr:phage holin family protein [Desulfobacterales bacterium]
MLIRWLTLTCAVIVSAYLLNGIHVSGFFSAFLAAAVLATLNTFLRPILFILTLPITLMTLGLFTLVINAVILKIAAALIPGFHIVGFWPAVLAALVISGVDWLLARAVSGLRPPPRPNASGGGEEPGSVIDLKDRGSNRWE